MKEIKDKVEARMQKRFFTEMLIMAVSTGANHSKYIEVVKDSSVWLRKKLLERNLIKKIKHRPKEFWSLKGKKKVYNIDGGQLSLSVTGSATMGIRVGVYKVKPGDFSKEREDYDDSSVLISNLVDRTGKSHYEEDDDFQLDYKRMLEGSRMIMELAEVVKQSEGRGKWKDKPSKTDVIFLHGPIIFEAAMYHLTSDANISFPPFKKEFCENLLSHKPNFYLDRFKNPQKEDDRLMRTFIPLYCEIANYIKNSKIPTYGVVERSGSKSPGAVTKAMVGELYLTRARKAQLEYRGLVNSWKTKRVDGSDEGEKLLELFTKYPLSDANLFDLLLDDGEYIQPIQLVKQIYSKWPQSDANGFYNPFYKLTPEPFVTYLKASEFKKPFRVETLNITDQYEKDIDLIYHSAKLLPQYCFPLGLDTVDKLAKIPSWMRNSMRNEYQMRMMRSLIDTGKKEHIELGLKSLIPKRTGWNRP
jgi:hypothetical protein